MNSYLVHRRQQSESDPTRRRMEATLSNAEAKSHEPLVSPHLLSASNPEAEAEPELCIEVSPTITSQHLWISCASSDYSGNVPIASFSKRGSDGHGPCIRLPPDPHGTEPRWLLLLVVGPTGGGDPCPPFGLSLSGPFFGWTHVSAQILGSFGHLKSRTTIRY